MIEYVRGNRNYLKYFDADTVVTSVLNLIELYFLILREHDEEKADVVYTVFKQYQTGIEEQDIRKGMRLRLKAKLDKIDLSYADATGYAMSERLGAKFLTGDSSFKMMPNVEFVK
jgi:predicted nucleic acid-binding protein